MNNYLLLLKKHSLKLFIATNFLVANIISDQRIVIYNNTSTNMYMALVRTTKRQHNKMISDDKINAVLLSDAKRTLQPLPPKSKAVLDNFTSNMLKYDRTLWVADNALELTHALQKMEIMPGTTVLAQEVGSGGVVVINGSSGDYTARVSRANDRTVRTLNIATAPIVTNKRSIELQKVTYRKL